MAGGAIEDQVKFRRQLNGSGYEQPNAGRREVPYPACDEGVLLKRDHACLEAPWRAEPIPGGYVVRDANGQALAFVYTRDSDAEARQAKVLTKDEARRMGRRSAIQRAASVSTPVRPLICTGGDREVRVLRLKNTGWENWRRLCLPASEAVSGIQRVAADMVSVS
jgi:hypothetical protein